MAAGATTSCCRSRCGPARMLELGTPVAFKEANLMLGPPAGCSEDEVSCLPVRQLDGNLVSCWSLTEEERDEVARTGVVWLSVWGRDTQPPVFVTGHKTHVI